KTMARQVSQIMRILRVVDSGSGMGYLGIYGKWCWFLRKQKPRKQQKMRRKKIIDFFGLLGRKTYDVF
ncbi:MAG: hypothetical protein KAV87_51680, partial [Desulfobacteraceae bacterium]|nr:hypothetical protein [Desulfobacteraceae bacterium]